MENSRRSRSFLNRTVLNVNKVPVGFLNQPFPVQGPINNRVIRFGPVQDDFYIPTPLQSSIQSQQRIQQRRHHSEERHNINQNNRNPILTDAFEQLKNNYETKRQGKSFEEQIKRDQIYNPSELVNQSIKK